MIHDDTNFTFNIYGRLNHAMNVCNDQYVGTICFNNEFSYQNQTEKFGLMVSGKRKKSFIYQNRIDVDYSKNISKNNGIMVVLLESPHISEFGITNEPFNTAPAWGKTGQRFNGQFINLLNNNISKFGKLGKSKYDVYLVNAIRYQTSFGLSPIISRMRDYIFTDMWNNLGFKDDLHERITKLAPDIIINCITKNLKELVQSEIENISGSVVLKASTHPSVWNYNTTLEK